MLLRFNFLSIQEEVNDILFILNLVLPLFQINTYIQRVVLNSSIFAKKLTIHPAPSHLPLCSISSTSITILPKKREFGVCVHDTRKRYAFLYQRGNMRNMHVS